MPSSSRVASFRISLSQDEIIMLPYKDIDVQLISVESALTPDDHDSSKPLTAIEWYNTTYLLVRMQKLYIRGRGEKTAAFMYRLHQNL